MIRSFFCGAIAGFLFGSSKQGAQLRQSIDRFLADLTSREDAAKLNEFKEELFENASERIGEFKDRFSMASGGTGDGNGSRRYAKKGDVAEHRLEQPKEKKATKKADSDTTSGAGVPLAKAQELADTLNTKPTLPPSEELSP